MQVSLCKQTHSYSAATQNSDKEHIMCMLSIICMSVELYKLPQFSSYSLSWSFFFVLIKSIIWKRGKKKKSADQNSRNFREFCKSFLKNALKHKFFLWIMGGVLHELHKMPWTDIPTYFFWEWLSHTAKKSITRWVKNFYSFLFLTFL